MIAKISPKKGFKLNFHGEINQIQVFLTVSRAHFLSNVLLVFPAPFDRS